ncbi:MAG: MBL fold metallo-hydrolase [SAR324 cluster bacterium]|uniref:MBL fold metallo-hydrolase n=1 Tax=SAR324 cluster bacterium TaxID=2024889 RepID=A0A2A4SUG0_9DELT|nr:MAG: MBL fold metallo-hydrolase [SAR324 cluster bacterium]
MLVHTLPVSPFMMNCYIVACEKTKEAVIIDAGDEPERIMQVIENEGYQLKFLINTHGHVDHVSGVAAIRNKQQVPFLMHQDEDSILRFLGQSQEMYGFGDGLIPAVDEYLDPKKEYSFGELTIEVIPTPGHTPGGVCLWIGEEIFVGDTLFAGSIGRTDLPGGSTETLLNSIKTQLMTLDENLVVHCGHGPDTTIGNEKRMNPFLV